MKLEDIKNKYANLQGRASFAHMEMLTDYCLDDLIRFCIKAKLEEAAERAEIEATGQFKNPYIANKDSITETPLD